MGRIKTMLIKRTTNELISHHGEKFSENFDENKQHVASILPKLSKKLRNVIAGYVTRLTKKSKEA